MNVTERVRELMQKRGWSEYRLVKETQLPASTISNIFHRETVPSIATLEVICGAFGISLCQFFAEGDFIAPTVEQSLLLSRWATLTHEQQETLLELIGRMNQRERE